MGFSLDLFFSGALEKRAEQAVLDTNEHTAKYGILLTESEAHEIVISRNNSLKASGRIEFGEGIAPLIINEFCDSPYIRRSEFVDTVAALIDIFYYYKNETQDKVSDRRLVHIMKKAFDGPCAGSLELLSERELFNFSALGKRGADIGKERGRGE